MNMKINETAFMINRERAVDYLNTRDRLYVVDGFVGWDPEHRVKVRVVCSRAYHGKLGRTWRTGCTVHAVTCPNHSRFMLGQPSLMNSLIITIYVQTWVSPLYAKHADSPVGSGT